MLTIASSFPPHFLLHTFNFPLVMVSAPLASTWLCCSAQLLQKLNVLMDSLPRHLINCSLKHCLFALLRSMYGNLGQTASQPHTGPRLRGSWTVPGTGSAPGEQDPQKWPYVLCGRVLARAEYLVRSCLLGSSRMDDCFSILTWCSQVEEMIFFFCSS